MGMFPQRSFFVWVNTERSGDIDTNSKYRGRRVKTRTKRSKLVLICNKVSRSEIGGV